MSELKLMTIDLFKKDRFICYQGNILIIKYLFQNGVLLTDFLIDGRRIGCFEGLRITAGGLELGTQVTPWGWIFWTIIFLI